MDIRKLRFGNTYFNCKYEILINCHIQPIFLLNPRLFQTSTLESLHISFFSQICFLFLTTFKLKFEQLVLF